MHRPIREHDVLECQRQWADAVVAVSRSHWRGGDFALVARESLLPLYGFGHFDVLFKPTKAADLPFRATAEEAVSYFVGAAAGDAWKEEDAGFATNGGKGWEKVVFRNHQVAAHGDVALAMGSYDFTCATTGEVATVHYTFGYKRCADGTPRICLHHSSVPYRE